VAGTCGAAFFTTPAAIMAAHFGWRSVHLLAGVCMALIAVALWLLVPDHDLHAIDPRARSDAPVSNWRLVRRPEFSRIIPLSLLGQGGAIALQTLWAGPWLTDVLGMSPKASSTVLLTMMGGMMAGYFLMGLVTRPLQQRFGMGNVAVVGYACNFVLVLLIGLAPWHGAWVLWPLLSLSMVPISLMQTHVSLQFPREVAGRVVSLYNMFIFAGAFGVQWAVGFGIDTITGLGAPRNQAFAWMLIGLAVLQCVSLLSFLLRPPSK
jgi:predicted MFS family arabinose efflux permease